MVRVGLGERDGLSVVKRECVGVCVCGGGGEAWAYACPRFMPAMLHRCFACRDSKLWP